MQDQKEHPLDNIMSNPDKKSADTAKQESAQDQDGWSDESINYVVSRRGLDEKYREALFELRARLEDIKHPMNCAKDVVRFIIARSGNVDTAEAMFRKSMAWRGSVGADTVTQNPPPQPIIDNIPGAIIEGCDKDGDPIFVERFISCDSLGIIERYGKDALIHHAIWIRESVVTGEWNQAYKEKHGSFADRITVIVDMKDLSWRHMHHKVIQVFGEVSRLDQDNYPEGAKRIILIRVPVVFQIVWAIVKHFIDRHVAAKMEVCGKNHREVLARYVDLEILPSVIVEEGQGRVVDGLPPNLQGGRLAVPPD